MTPLDPTDLVKCPTCLWVGDISDCPGADRFSEDADAWCPKCGNLVDENYNGDFIWFRSIRHFFLLLVDRRRFNRYLNSEIKKLREKHWPII